MESVYERCCRDKRSQETHRSVLANRKAEGNPGIWSCTRELLLLADWLQEQCCRPVHSQLDSTVILIRACGYALPRSRQPPQYSRFCLCSSSRFVG